jgi:anti-sigma B factor antagonist
VKDFSIGSKVLGEVAVLYPSGYLNNIVGEGLEEMCTSFLKKGVKKIVLNFKDIELINSIGISILLGIMDNMKDTGADLCFAHTSKLHNDTFQMLGLTKLMNIFGCEEDALKHLEEKA